MSRTQFSVRHLLAVIAVVGIGAALWVAERSWQAGAAELLLTSVILPAIVILSVKSTGRAKAFWLGLAIESVSSSIVWFVSVGIRMCDHPYGVDTALEKLQLALLFLTRDFRSLLLAWLFGPVGGLLCMFTYWLMAHSADRKCEPMPRRRWLRFSLRGLFALLTVFAVGFGVIVNPAREQREAVKAIEAAGGSVHYDWEYRTPRGPAGPAWLRLLVGDELFQDVALVDFSGVSEDGMLRLAPFINQRLRKLALVVCLDGDNNASTQRAVFPNCTVIVTENRDSTTHYYPPLRPLAAERILK
jgi:hypothetical protein